MGQVLIDTARHDDTAIHFFRSAQRNADGLKHARENRITIRLPMMTAPFPSPSRSLLQPRSRQKHEETAALWLWRERNHGLGLHFECRAVASSLRHITIEFPDGSLPWGRSPFRQAHQGTDLGVRVHGEKEFVANWRQLRNRFCGKVSRESHIDGHFQTPKLV